MKSSIAAKWLSVPLLAAVTGCVSTARMALPDGQVAQAEYPVSGANPYRWDKAISFGRWHTEQLTDYGRVDGGLPLGKVELGGTYHARNLTTNTGTKASCDGWLVSVDKKGLALDPPTLGHLPILSCTFSGTQQGELSLKQDHRGRLRGQLVTATAVYDIESVHQLDGSVFSSPMPVGFQLKRQQQLLWSVEKVNAGRVLLWQQGPAAEQDLLAATSFVLLVTDLANLSWDDEAG